MIRVTRDETVEKIVKGWISRAKRDEIIEKRVEVRRSVFPLCRLLFSWLVDTRDAGSS